MAEQDLRWYVFGAQAAIIWGSPRVSADVDSHRRNRTGRHRFVRAVDEAPRIRSLFSDAEFVARTRVLPFVHGDTRMPALGWRTSS